MELSPTPRLDEHGHFPGCYSGYGCEATRCAEARTIAQWWRAAHPPKSQPTPTDRQIAAVLSAAHVLYNEHARSAAAELLAVFGCNQRDVDAIFALFGRHDGHAEAEALLRDVWMR